MGPGLVLDKSAVEAIGSNALHVQSDLFYTVVTPILVWEICGDIEKARRGKVEESKVRALAKKAKPFDSIVTTDWRKLCFGELSGYRFNHPVPGNRRPVVEGAHRVPLPGGGYGEVLDEQPEARALLRWAHGDWSDDDHTYAESWRRTTRALDLETFKRRFGPARKSPETIDDLKRLVELVLRDPSLQFFYVQFLLEEMAVTKAISLSIQNRWRGSHATTWQAKCPFTSHCVKTLVTFYLALSGGIIGTRSTNRVDLEYLFYTPFAPIFVSGDLLSHGKLAPILLAQDQVFVSASDFRAALQAEADRRAALQEAGTPHGTEAWEPPEDSLLRSLWVKAWGKFRPPPSASAERKSSDPPRPSTIMEEFKRAMDYVEAHPELYRRRPPWPQL